MSALRKARALFDGYYAHMLEYRAELIFWMLAGLFPFILMGVWMKAAESGRFPLDPAAFGRYFFAVFIVRQLTVVWVIFEFEPLVSEGRLAPFLLQPIDPVWRHFAVHVTERFARAPFFIALLVFVYLIHPPLFQGNDVGSLMLGLGATLLAFILRFTIQYTIAMAAFWTERAISIQSLWFLCYLFLSGVVAPLDVFPESIRGLARALPFPYLVEFPARLLIGLPVDISQGFIAMGLWFAGFLTLNRILWRRGLKRFSGMGA